MFFKDIDHLHFLIVNYRIDIFSGDLFLKCDLLLNCDFLLFAIFHTGLCEIFAYHKNLNGIGWADYEKLRGSNSSSVYFFLIFTIIIKTEFSEAFFKKNS